LLTGYSLSNHDKRYNARAIYLHVVKEKPAKTKRFYVGQSRKFQERMAKHMDFRHWEENPSLHNYALRRSESDYYVILSFVPDARTCHRLGIRGDCGKDAPLLDLLETWCCLMFQTLPERYLREFLPQGIPIQTNNGLNLQLPLRSSDSFRSDGPEIRNILAESPDPLHQAFYSWQSLKFNHNKKDVLDHHERGLEICKRLDGISTPSPPTFLSPPTTGSNLAQDRRQLEASKQPSPSTPSMTRSTAPSRGESRGSILADTEASKTDSSAHRKRKRDDDPFTESKDLTELPTKRQLGFDGAVKPKDDLY